MDKYNIQYTVSSPSANDTLILSKVQATIFVLTEAPSRTSNLTFSAVHCDNQTCFNVQRSLRMRFPQMMSTDKSSGIDSLLCSNCFTWNTQVLMEHRMNL